MKNLILGLILSIVTVYGLRAQSELAFGIKGGVNFANLTGEGFNEFDENSARTSFHLGALVEIPISSKFAIQPEVLYSGQGFDLIQRDGGDDTTFSLDYVNVPILAKIYLVNGLYLEAGPQFGFLAESKIKDPNGEINFDTDNFNSMDIGGAVGLGYKFDGGLFFNARYTQGFTDIYDGETGDGATKNGVFAASIGLILN